MKRRKNLCKGDNIMKKTFVFVLLAAALAVLLSLAVSAMDNGIMYEIVDDAVTITGYNGISTTIVIPEEIEGKPVTRIARYAFDRMNITGVTIPDTVEEIGEKAFFRCFELTQIDLPKSLKSIGHNAFAYTGLVEVDLSVCPNLKNVGAYAFAYCEQLKKITLSNDEITYGKGIIMECPELETINNISILEDLSSYFSGNFKLFTNKPKTITVNHKVIINGNVWNYIDVEEIIVEDPTGTIVDGRILNIFPSLKKITLGERITEPEEWAMTMEQYGEYLKNWKPEDGIPKKRYEYYDIDQERGIIYNKTRYDDSGIYEMVYVLPEWEGAEILYMPDDYTMPPACGELFNQCKRKAVVFSNMKFAGGFGGGDVGNTVFFFPERVEIPGVRTASLQDYTPETYPYNDFSSEPVQEKKDTVEKIADNSKYTKSALAVDMPFTDVSPEAWYFAATNYAYHNGITSGTGEGLFAPDVNLTRAMFVQMIAKIEKADLDSYADRNTFTDVKAGTWYHNAVEWAYENGIVSGMGNGIFAPDDMITREQMAVILYALVGNDDNSAEIEMMFNDASTVSSWAFKAMKWAVGSGYISGMGDKTLSPKSNATRAQALQILYRYIDNTKIDYAQTEIKVSKAFSDNMIIQRGEKITVWGELADRENEGRADIGKYVKVDLGGKSFGYGVIDENGQWKAELDRILPASDEKIKLTVSTNNQKYEYDGIMLGDVYMLIGQSNVYYSINNYATMTNMFFPAYFTYDFAPYLHKTKYMDNVRLFKSSSEDYKYYYMTDYTVYDDVLHERGWQKPDDPAKDFKGVNGQEDSTFYDYRRTGAEPMACEIFSAYGYFTACEIYERTGVPTGMIQVDGSGYSIGAFMPGELCEEMHTDTKQGTQYTDIVTGMKSRFIYNQCIHPLENLSIAGLIWYQGESDGFNTTWSLSDPSTSFAYRWSALMEYLRVHMGNSDFPVFLTEFPMCAAVSSDAYIDLGGVRADESLAIKMTNNSYLISTSDLWTNKSYFEQVHLPAKPAMAKRLGQMMANIIYGNSNDISKSCGPIMTNVEYGDGEIIVTFDNVGDGLKFYGGTYTGGFTLNSEITIIPQGMFPVNGRIRTPISDPKNVQIIGKDKVRIECDYSEFAGIAYNACSANSFPANCNLCNSYNIPAVAFSSYK